MIHRTAVEFLLLLLLAGCATMGTGIGYTPAGARPATFSWRSSDGHSGTMQATLSDGTNYRGKYHQITRDKKFDGAMLFDGWYSGWDETDWGVGSSPDFVAHYTDRVIADLASPSGSRMRCQFQLVYPDNGMYGGGGGECLLSGGEAIDVKFPGG
ncbi:MAG: hypothetical protein ACLQT5_09085 [Steroidobacteraceae bacterium]